MKRQDYANTITPIFVMVVFYIHVKAEMIRTHKENGMIGFAERKLNLNKVR